VYGSSILELSPDRYDFIDSVYTLFVGIKDKVFIYHKCFELTVVHVYLLLLVLMLHLLLLNIGLHIVGGDYVLSENLIHLGDHF